MLILSCTNNQAALTYFQMLVHSEEDKSWRFGAMIRTASALERESEFEQAIEMWKQVRREEERKSGINALDVQRTARKIGSLFLRVGNLKEALQWTGGALAGMRRCSDPEAKMEEMGTLSLMSSLHIELGDLKSALTAQRDCVNGLEATLGESDEKTLGASLDLAEIYNYLGHTHEALHWYRKAITGYYSKLGDQPVKVMNAERALRELERTVGTEGC